MMADYIDKQKTLNVIFEIAENVIKSLPTSDVVEVVRCKDCRHHDGNKYCDLINQSGWYDEDFCNYGERKE